MARRGKTKHAPAHYVVRDKHGRFKNWVYIGRSIPADARWDAKKKLPKSKPGYGHRADYPKTPKKQREVKGFYTDKQGKVRPITSRGVSKDSLEKAEKNKDALSKPKR